MPRDDEETQTMLTWFIASSDLAVCEWRPKISLPRPEAFFGPGAFLNEESIIQEAHRGTDLIQVSSAQSFRTMRPWRTTVAGRVTRIWRTDKRVARLRHCVAGTQQQQAV